MHITRFRMCIRGLILGSYIVLWIASAYIIIAHHELSVLGIR